MHLITVKINSLFMRLTFVISAFCLLVFSGCDNNQADKIENSIYKIVVPDDFKSSSTIFVSYKPGKIERNLKPALRIVYSKEDPQITSASVDGYQGIIGWRRESKQIEKNIFNLEGLDIVATDYKMDGDKFIFDYETTQFGNVTMQIHLKKDSPAPRITFNLKVSKTGWYSIGFTGLTSENHENLDFLYQPLTWSWKRFPSETCITEEAFCTTAAAFINTQGFTEGIAPAHDMIPYRYAFSTHWNEAGNQENKFWGSFPEKKGNSLFGLSIRNQKGNAQPMIFAPLLGGEGSYMSEGDEYSFSSNYILVSGDWIEGSNYILGNLFNYKNERKNATYSLNQSLENMISFAMNDRFSGWEEEYKAFNYRFDAPGTVKMVSALHPLSLSVLTGDIDIYKRRALPLIEYVMSREKFLFAIDTAQKIQNPSFRLKGPAAEIGELAGLYQFTNNQNPVFREEALRIFGKPRMLNLETVSVGNTWKDYLELYRITSNPEMLKKAEEGAMEYIYDYVEKYPTDFTSNSGLIDRQAAFQTDFSTNIFDLYELFEITQNRHYLDAAYIGARHLLLWTRSNPVVPDSFITVNQGGKVDGIFPGRREGVVNHNFVSRDVVTTVSENKIEAWRTSLNGLFPEQHGTYAFGPIMLSHHAAWFLRLATLKNDKILADAAYNSIIGRYGNFPGYYFTSLHTDVYQKADYPLRDYYDIKYNAIFYNHVWPHIALLTDFLFSDAFYRSEGEIDFQSVYAPGYAFLTSKVYGGMPGKIFDEDGIRPWLPSNAIKSCSNVFNHFFGIGNNALYLVLINTSKSMEKIDILLNQDVISYKSGKTYKASVLDNKGKIVSSTEMLNGKINANLAPNTLQVIRIEDIKIEIMNSHEFSESSLSETNNGYFRMESMHQSIGNVTGMSIRSIDGSSDLYIYSDVMPYIIKKARLLYRKSGSEKWVEIEDSSYPFEFSIHIGNQKANHEFIWKSESKDGRWYQSEVMKF
jgi:hypothetical protein